MIDRGRGARRWTSCAVAVTAFAVANHAAADTPSNEVAAQALFDEAKATMLRGDYVSACPKLEESQRLQPAGGTLLFLALCREGEGKTATAWARYNEALSMARRDGRPDRERVAKEHIAVLEPKLTRIDVVVPAENRAVEGIQVLRDSEPVPPAIWGTGIPVDPGSHTVRATAPGMKPWQAVVQTAGDGSTATVTVPALERDTLVVAPPPPPTPVAVPPPIPASPQTTPVESSSDGTNGRGQRTIAIILGGVGVVGLGIGTYFGVAALSKKSDENAANGCPGGSSGPCNSNGVGISRDAVSDGNAASIALGLGAAAIAGAAVLWLTAPSAGTVSVAPTVGRGSAGVALQGAWW